LQDKIYYSRVITPLILILELLNQEQTQLVQIPIPKTLKLY